VPSDPGPELVPNDPHFGALQFTSDEVECVLQDLDVNKGSEPDGIRYADIQSDPICWGESRKKESVTQFQKISR
jgi:hypothetical protein